MRRLTILAIALLALSVPLPAYAQRIKPAPAPEPQAPQLSEAPPASDVPALGGRIAAIVNENVITTFDIDERVKLGLLSSGLPDTPDVRARILPQVLRSLVDEQLQAQESKRLDITVPQDEIDQAMQKIAADNHIPGGDMRAYLKSHGASPATLEAQLRVALAWNKVIARELRPTISVGDDEIDAVAARIRANAGKEEYLVSEIFLAVDSPKDEDQVKGLAGNLVQQIKGGAGFGAVAHQFSQGAAAAAGGDIGWIQEGQLPEELDRALASSQQGDIIGPLRSASGYHILGVREKRTIAAGDPKDITLDIRQAFRPMPAGTDTKQVLAEADQIRASVDGCADLAAKLVTKFPDWHLQESGKVKAAEAPTWIADKIRDLPTGRASETIATGSGALLLFVCGKQMPEGNIDRTAILNSIGTEKLELQARRLIRDLRSSAFLDIRLGAPS
jgi:peptidyl-prolyl cis-trans isomerase SurA